MSEEWVLRSVGARLDVLMEHPRLATPDVLAELVEELAAMHVQDVCDGIDLALGFLEEAKRKAASGEAVDPVLDLMDPASCMVDELASRGFQTDAEQEAEAMSGLVANASLMDDLGAKAGDETFPDPV